VVCESTRAPHAAAVVAGATRGAGRGIAVPWARLVRLSSVLAAAHARLDHRARTMSARKQSRKRRNLLHSTTALEMELVSGTLNPEPTAMKSVLFKSGHSRGARQHRRDLRRLGVRTIALFGSYAQDSGPKSTRSFRRILRMLWRRDGTTSRQPVRSPRSQDRALPVSISWTRRRLPTALREPSNSRLFA
jgi:hypothetical protein